MPLPLRGDETTAAQVWETSVDGWMHLIDSNRELWITMLSVGAAGRDTELQEIVDAGREHTAGRAIEALGLEPALTRTQARELLLRSLPLLVEQLLPQLLEAADAADPTRSS